MIKRETFTKKNIDRIVSKYNIDYELGARAVFALGLVEALSKVNSKFIFKGGSPLMLLFGAPKRLSTDVDILVEPDYDIEFYLNKASEIFPFKGIEESKRITNKKISKKHFKITYASTNSDRDLTVIVDVVFAQNHYSKLVHAPINNDLLLCEGEDYFVDIPCAESLLADKLTAFAPHTIGIKFCNDDYSNDKRLEVIKQFYDISCLFDFSKDFQIIKETYGKIATDEINYRSLTIKPTDCLLDTFNSALCIVSNGKYYPEDFKQFIIGFKKIIGHIIGKRLNINNATYDGGKIMFLAACLIKNIDPFNYRIKDQSLIENPDYNKVNFTKKIDQKSFNYIASAIDIISK